MLRKNELEKDSYYIGSSRSANIAMWNGIVFRAIGMHFDTPHLIEIKHIVDSGGYDGFIPIKKIHINNRQIQNSKQELKISVFKNTDINDIEGEIWKNIPGYDENYMVSNLGRVKSIKANTIMVQSFIERYLVVGIKTSITKKRKTMRVHRLVLKAFNPIDNDDKYAVNHKNGLRTDNNINNLEWITHKKNSEKMYKDGIFNYKLTPKQVKDIRNILSFGDVKQKDIAKKYNVSPSCISEINTNKKWKFI